MIQKKAPESPWDTYFPPRPGSGKTVKVTIQPDPNCRICHGRGEYDENQSPLGSGYNWPETFTCDCVLDQLPYIEDGDDIDIIIDAPRVDGDITS